MKPYDEKRMMEAFKSCDFKRTKKRSLKVEKHSLENIAEAYAELESAWTSSFVSNYEFYKKAAESLSQIDYRKENVGLIYSYLEERFASEWARGLFASAIINKAIDNKDNFTIFL